MDEPLNPVQIEAHLTELVTRISRGIRITSDRYAAFLEADREYDRAKARWYLEAEGPVKEREAVVELETAVEREARDVAEAAYKHADRQSKALDLEVRTYQSLGASVRQAYGNAGR
ncbi:hypothetical protein [Corynebacterium sp.]|uniref:hypothetical protein n=1 Tax=Corynebacterium sp. TaxID=1720 RepID=UPI0025BDC825|nr:hypothetical protein [Corynebacterium sp.]